MPRQLSADCLNEIFEYLEDDKFTLYSCLQVNHLYCKIAVRILWEDVWRFRYDLWSSNKAHVSLSIISTLIACLPKKSKDLLRKNGIITPTWKPSLFNYASFCKVLSIHGIDQMIQRLLENQRIVISESLHYSKYLLSQEILKMFMNQISSLKSLDYYSRAKVQSIMFTCFPGTKNCLTELTELNCSSDIYSEFFYQISQICHNIQSLTISFESVISNGLKDLISLQNNLKSVTLKLRCLKYEKEIKFITSSLAKFSLTLSNLQIDAFNMSISIPLSFIAMFTNLQELTIILNTWVDFGQLQYAVFPQLSVLRFLLVSPKVEMLIKFLEINGKNLTEFYVNEHDNLLDLAIAKFCPNLKYLFTIFMRTELETLKEILSGCQYLENIRITYGTGYLDKEFFEVLAKYSPKNFNKLGIDYYELSSNFLEELEEFFVSWGYRIPQKSLSLTILTSKDYLELYGENLDIMIEKYKRMSVIKRFNIKCTPIYCKELKFEYIKKE